MAKRKFDVAGFFFGLGGGDAAAWNAMRRSREADALEREKFEYRKQRDKMADMIALGRYEMERDTWREGEEAERCTAKFEGIPGTTKTD